MLNYFKSLLNLAGRFEGMYCHENKHEFHREINGIIMIVLKVKEKKMRDIIKKGKKEKGRERVRKERINYQKWIEHPIPFQT